MVHIFTNGLSGLSRNAPLQDAYVSQMNLVKSCLSYDACACCSVITTSDRFVAAHIGLNSQRGLGFCLCSNSLAYDKLLKNRVSFTFFLSQRLLQHYCVALPLRDNKYLLPSLLSTKQPSIRIPSTLQNALVNRVYTLAYLPPSFWPRLIARVQTFVVNLYADHQAVLESPREPQVNQWNEGVYVYWSDQAFFVISHGLTNPSAESVVITTPNTRHGARILSHVVDHLDSLLEEWFSELWCKCLSYFIQILLALLITE